MYCRLAIDKLMVQLSGIRALEGKHLITWDEHAEINRRLENRRYYTFWLLFKMKKKNTGRTYVKILTLEEGQR